MESQLPASVQIGALETAPVIDGTIEDGEWTGAAMIDQPFLQFQPDFGKPSSFRTACGFQTNSAIDRENVQALWVWRFKPPFGSWQLAYQRGISGQGQESEQDDTGFSKLARVF